MKIVLDINILIYTKVSQREFLLENVALPAQSNIEINLATPQTPSSNALEGGFNPSELNSKNPAVSTLRPLPSLKELEIPPNPTASEENPSPSSQVG